MRKIALLAGGGLLPKICAESALKQGDDVMAITFMGQPQPENMPEAVTMVMQPLGAINQALKTLKHHKVTHILLAGNLEKASLFTLKPDLAGLKFLAKHTLMHDDALLKSLIQLFENEGFSALSVKDIAPQILMPQGTLTQTKPTKKHLQDIQTGFDMLAHLSPLDVGQALIIKNGVVLGIEAIEGTQELICRCAPLRGEDDTGGILIKAFKKQQTDKADLPTIGDKTLAALSQYGYAGVAMTAEQTLLLNQEEALSIANQHQIFMFGA